MTTLIYGFKAEEIVEENRLTWDEINVIKKWNLTVNIPKLVDEQVVSFILSCDRDLEFTKKTVLEYFKVRLYSKELFNNRNIELPDMQLQLATLEYIELPRRTDDGYLIIYHKLHDNTYWKYNMGTSMKLLCMTLDVALYKYPPKGVIFLFDMKGVTLLHLTRVQLNNIKAFFHYCQEGLPVKLKAIHVLNCVYFMDKVMTIIKPFIKKELYKMLHFHSPNISMDKFYNTCIDKQYLPTDYGGDLPNTRILHEANTKNLAALKSFFDAEEEQRMPFFK